MCACSWRPGRIGYEALIGAAVLAEGRLECVLVVEPDQLPAHTVAIAAVCGHREHAEQREQPRRVEEWRALDLREVRDLLRRRERRKRSGTRMPGLISGLELGELAAIVTGERR